MGSRNDDYARAFKSAQREYHELAKQRDEIEKRMTQLQQFMVTSSPLAGEDPPQIDMGLTDVIRHVLRSAGEIGLSPRQIETLLPTMGISVNNPRIAIHVVLKRLMEAEQVQQFRDVDQSKRYRWIGRDPVVTKLPEGADPFRSFLAEPVLPPEETKTSPSGIKRIVGDSQARRERLLGKKDK